MPESLITTENGPLPETGRPSLRLVKLESLRTRSTPVSVLVSLSKYCSGSFDQIERTGWEERLYYAEVLRIKGWMLAMKGNADGAEKWYLASLEWARKQEAKSWELRTATSLARLLQLQHKNKEARNLLTPIYNWFTEGFDTGDLKDAKLLLEELGYGD
jgi:hypothetical protein